VQVVLYSWLVTVVLGADAEAVGVAQMAGQLPTLLLILWAGSLADRIDPRRILIVAHLLAALPPLALAGVLAADRLVYAGLLAWALAAGTLNALALPARDALLSRVADGALQRAVAVAMGIQFGLQVGGYALAAQADRWGAGPLLVAMALLFATGAVTAARLPRRGPRPPAAGAESLDGIGVGLRAAWRSAAIRPALVMVAGSGVFYAGAFMVLLPLLVRDVYAGGAREIAILYGAMMLGTLVSIGALIARGGLARPGRGQLLASGLGAPLLGALALAPPLPVAYALVFAWGMMGGVAMTTGRGIVQEQAPEALRGRVLSVYSLANFGSIPFGSLLLGLAAGALGARGAALVPAVAMAVLTILVALTTDYARLRSASPVTARRGPRSDGG
jgi:MFS family permease